MKANIRIEANARRATKRPKSVVTRILTAPAGGRVRVTSVDALSATFAADFLYVFKSNVGKARRDNLAVQEAADKS